MQTNTDTRTLTTTTTGETGASSAAAVVLALVIDAMQMSAEQCVSLSFFLSMHWSFGGTASGVLPGNMILRQFRKMQIRFAFVSVVQNKEQ